jgi:hypothetical protein
MHYLFTIQFLEPALQFIERLEPKSQEKVLYVLWKARITKDAELFKKSAPTFGSFECCIKKSSIVCCPFGTNLKPKYAV